MEVIVDGVKYLPANIVQPKIEELKKYLAELKSRSQFEARKNVPPELVYEADSGRPALDKAYDKRYCFDNGYRHAIGEVEYWIENFEKEN